MNQIYQYLKKHFSANILDRLNVYLSVSLILLGFRNLSYEKPMVIESQIVEIDWDNYEFDFVLLFQITWIHLYFLMASVFGQIE